MSNDKKNYDTEVDSIIKNAKGKIYKIKSKARDQIAQIIVDLANDLVDKIPEDDIVPEIVSQLKKQVNEVTIRMHIDEKFHRDILGFIEIEDRDEYIKEAEKYGV